MFKFLVLGCFVGNPSKATFCSTVSKFLQFIGHRAKQNCKTLYKRSYILISIIRILRSEIIIR